MMCACVYSLLARGRTNIELREKFILPEGASQGMTPFRSRGRRSKPSSRAASPTRSSSSASQSNHSCTSMPSSPATPASGTKVRTDHHCGTFPVPIFADVHCLAQPLKGSSEEENVKTFKMTARGHLLNYVLGSLNQECFSPHVPSVKLSSSRVTNFEKPGTVCSWS